MDFTMAELESLLEFVGIELADAKIEWSSENPLFVFLDIPTEDIVSKICSRSILIKKVYLVWAASDNLTDLVGSTRQLYESKSELILPFTKSTEMSFCIDVVSHNRSLSMEEKERLRNHFKFLDFMGPVNIKNPDTTIALILDYSKFLRELQDGSFMESNPEFPVIPCYYGRLIGIGGMRDETRKYNLKKRLYLGPTSLDHNLAMIMANLAGIKENHMVLDPFVGTASILVAASHHKAICTGADIDLRVLKGLMYAGSKSHELSTAAVKESQYQGKPFSRDIFETFRDYDLKVPELIRMDLHCLDKHIHMLDDCEGIYDAIVTDPPYGIRAGGRKTGNSKYSGTSYSISKEKRHDHIPSTQNYPVEEVMLDLLHASAKLLVMGGILVYLIPTPYDFETTDLPVHPCLETKKVCLQQLSTRHGRHAVVLKKTKKFTSETEELFNVYKSRVLEGNDDGFGLLMDKLTKALAPDAFDNDDVIKRSSKLATKRRKSKLTRQELRKATPIDTAGGLSEFSELSLDQVVVDEKAI